jgi:hypothetical protein
VARRCSKSHCGSHTPYPPPSLQNCKALLVGFPGGKVCTEQQLPGYVEAVSVFVCVRGGVRIGS